MYALWNDIKSKYDIDMKYGWNTNMKYMTCTWNTNME